MLRPASIATLLLLGTACGIDASKIPTHHLYADDGAAMEMETLSFAIVGSTRTLLPGGDPTIVDAVIADIGREAPTRDLEFVVLTGNYVRRSATADWAGFGDQWKEVLKGELLSSNKGRRKVAPIPGSGEYLGDRRLEGFGAAFDGVGVDIGLNRVGSWWKFDAKIGSERWRFVFVDTHKAALGSRWDEQVFWLPKAVAGDDYDSLVVFMPDPLITMAQGATMDPNDGPSELLAIIEENTGMMKLMAVVSGGPATNEVYLPSGNFGELFLVAANSGVPMPDLARWGPADDAGYKDLQLEAMFDLAVMNEFDDAAEAVPFEEKTIDHAKARGTFESFTAAYEGKHFPIQGWWTVDIEGRRMRATLRMREHDGKFRDVYRVNYTKKDGWVGQVIDE